MVTEEVPGGTALVVLMLLAVLVVLVKESEVIGLTWSQTLLVQLS